MQLQQTAVVMTLLMGLHEDMAQLRGQNSTLIQAATEACRYCRSGQVSRINA